MPLKSGSSDSVIQWNIGELMRTYRRTGKIGDSTPENAEAAARQAAAIAYQKAGRSRKKD